ncbi:MAG: HD domain-containing protein [Lachnospiraceae bacterium]|nr:HD domain-containing protein [Lachnospiraceae bacterium]
MLLLCVAGILLNFTGTSLAHLFSLPLFLDTIGTALAAAFGGIIPGMIVGFVSNLLNTVKDSTTIYYGVLNTLIAIAVSVMAQKGYFRKVSKSILSVFILALIGGCLGSLITWFLYGFAAEGISVSFVKTLYESGHLGKFGSQLMADYLIDLADKGITVLIVVLCLYFVPEKAAEEVRFEGWHQRPMTSQERKEVQKNRFRSISLRTKVLLLLFGVLFLVSASATLISYHLYYQASVTLHTSMGAGVAKMAADAVDAEMVDLYLEEGEDAPGYLETLEKLAAIRESSPDIQYIYVYQIRPDGCHVVFDVDTPETEGSDPGEIIPFDEGFMPLLDDLLAGEHIDPIITDDSFGFLLTAYEPVYNKGRCVCYAATDISMEQLRADSYTFFAKMASLFLNFTLLVSAIGVWMAEFNIIFPVNSMAMAAGDFIYNSEADREESAKRIKRLSISTGDEIENMYQALIGTTQESLRYMTEMQEKNETITKMQNGLILVLADLVESRDKCTGDHVHKTAEYARLIMMQMLKEEIYPDLLTEEFIHNVENAAPLHDVGKIVVPDAILNKPGRLTDDEYAIMKQHTSAGKEIISRAVAIVPDAIYLTEAMNMSGGHHERWDGKGYPEGLKGEEIPLSARIMAVSDVFDALVSKRSYKDGMTYEQAIEIIEAGRGTQFDPQVVDAFLHAEAGAREIMERYAKKEAGEEN